MKLFQVDGGFYKFMNRLLEIIKLNFLWILCSLPIVTMGAATVAAYKITLQMVDETEGYIARPFFKAFKENLRQGSLMGVLSMVAAYAIYLDFQLFNAVEGNPIIFIIIGMFAIFLFIMSVVYAFPLLARYENSIWKTLKNSYRIATRYFLRTLLLVVVLLLEFAIIFWNQTTIFVGALIGPACVIYTISGFALYFFRQIEKEPGSVVEE